MARTTGLVTALFGVFAIGLSPIGAGVLELRDGTRLQGELRGADDGNLHFETAEGVRTVPMDEAVALRFQDGEAGSAAATPAPTRAKPPTASAQSHSKPAAQATQSASGLAPTPPVPAAAPAPATPETRRVQLAAGTKLHVRLGDTIDPRQATEGDRFSALLETPIMAGALTVVPAHSTVYGVITEASLTGPPAHRIQLELKELQISGQPVAIVTGTHNRVAAPEASGPANASPPGDARLPSGAVLEFRLLQPLELVVRAR